jgi:hypothetical protein
MELALDIQAILPHASALLVDIVVFWLPAAFINYLNGNLAGTLLIGLVLTVFEIGIALYGNGYGIFGQIDPEVYKNLDTALGEQLRQYGIAYAVAMVLNLLPFLGEDTGRFITPMTAFVLFAILSGTFVNLALPVWGAFFFWMLLHVSVPVRVVN